MKETKQKILEFIVAYIQKHSYPPTVREIGEGVGLKSTSSVQSHIVRMLDCGMIETDAGPKSTRAIRVPGYKFVKEEALERNQPKQVTDISGDKLRFGTCPCCRRRISDVEGGNYCQSCGQRLEWKE